MKKIWQAVKEWTRENRFLIKPFVVLLIIYLVGVAAIILAGVHYADDVARTTFGYAGWSAFSRYISTVLSHGLHADNYLTNIYPLPQILAAVLLAGSSMVVACVAAGKEIFKQKWTKWIWMVVAVVPVGLCPYMLECLSYQYDAVYMGLSVAFAVLPLVFYRKSRGWYIAAIVVGMLGVCMTYQASIGIFPILVIMMGLKDWNEGRKDGTIKNVALSAVVFLLTLVVFQKLLMTSREVYVSNSVPGIGELIPSFLAHLGEYLTLVVKDFKVLWLVVLAVMAVSFVVVFAVRSKRNKIAAVALALVGVVAMTVMAYAMYSVLERPLYTTRAMYAIGAVIAVVGAYVVGGVVERGGLRLLAVVPVVVLAWCFFTFGFTYGNALAEQNVYRDRQLDMAISDLNEMAMLRDGKVRAIQATGEIGLAPVVAHMPESDFRMVRRLLKPTFGGDVPWMAYRLTEVSGLNGLVFKPEVDLTAAELPVVKETIFYTIYVDDEGVLVEFRGSDFGLEY